MFGSGVGGGLRVGPIDRDADRLKHQSETRPRRRLGLWRALRDSGLVGGAAVDDFELFRPHVRQL